MAKKEIDVHGIWNNTWSRTDPEPLVQLLGFNTRDSEISEFTFKPKFAKQLCAAIMEAAEAAQNGESLDLTVKVKDWED